MMLGIRFNITTDRCLCIDPRHRVRRDSDRRDKPKVIYIYMQCEHLVGVLEESPPPHTSLPHNDDREGNDSCATSSATVTSNGDNASATVPSTSPESSADQRYTRSEQVIRPPKRL